MKYPYQGGKHSKLLKWMCGIYGAACVKALWDCFLIFDDNYCKQRGYSIEAFKDVLPKLADMPYKTMAKKYESSDNPLKHVRGILEEAIYDKTYNSP